MPTGPGLVKQKGTEHQNTVITLRASETILLASVKDLSIIHCSIFKATLDTAYSEIYSSNQKKYID